MSNISRRSLVADTDPAYAAVERFKSMYAEHGKSCAAEPAKPNGKAARHTAEYDAWEEANNTAGDKAWAAYEKMISTQPKSLAGAAALVRCYLDSDKREYFIDDESRVLLNTLYGFLRNQMVA